MERNKEMIQKLKDVKSIMVSRELRGDDWDDMQAAVSKLEPEKTLLIFDEVQEVPRALTSLKAGGSCFLY